MEATISDPKVLVIGASGQVGAQFLAFYQSLSRPESPLPAARHPERADWLQLDLATLDANLADEKLRGIDLRAVYVFAGMTNVDACEDQPELAFQTNAHGPAFLAAYANRQNIPFVYFSTEYVFGGKAERPGPYLEGDVPDPQNVYGASKLAGETAVREAHPGALIIRTTVVYGEDPQGKNYLYTVLRLLGTGSQLRVPQDQISTPTFNRDLIRATIGLVDAGASGVYHVCGPELLGRLEFAKRVAERFQLDSTLLLGKDTCELKQRAPRPLAAGLGTDKLRREFPNLVPRDLTACLDDCEPSLQPFLQSILPKS
ncbi:SDR family oxidoreductase [Terriglobus roseus]|uniref:dTDP-4-dehydrorhamnose reductase n=1 Tax=Terriglobus roseus TaxID=392734 RepID=A0A1H4ISR0_9BACT|nr:NAD(P)-dependent oxidoreductase [Terriglobus roseus]SEB37057.1 dTDP-4-dehydrorhamnose reductase [Terriglobus roseus]